jgi:ribosomal protein L32
MIVQNGIFLKCTICNKHMDKIEIVTKARCECCGNQKLNHRHAGCMGSEAAKRVLESLNLPDREEIKDKP